MDVYVGNRIRLRRILLGLSQQKLAEGLRLTFQQVQKYERGTNRICASRLWDLGGILGCTIAYFFEEMDEQTVGAGPRNWHGESHDIGGSNPDPINRRETLELIRAYYRITDSNIRRRIFELTKSFVSVNERTEGVLNTEISLQAESNEFMPDGHEQR